MTVQIFFEARYIGSWDESTCPCLTKIQENMKCKPSRLIDHICTSRRHTKETNDDNKQDRLRRAEQIYNIQTEIDRQLGAKAKKKLASIDQPIFTKQRTQISHSHPPPPVVLPLFLVFLFAGAAGCVSLLILPPLPPAPLSAATAACFRFRDAGVIAGVLCVELGFDVDEDEPAVPAPEAPEDDPGPPELPTEPPPPVGVDAPPEAILEDDDTEDCPCPCDCD